MEKSGVQLPPAPLQRITHCRRTSTARASAFQAEDAGSTPAVGSSITASQHCAANSVWLECSPFKRLVGGSNPSRRTTTHALVVQWQNAVSVRRRLSVRLRPGAPRGYGGIGRRASLRGWCRKMCGFESHYPHHSLSWPNWIRCRSPKPRMQVRFLPRAPYDRTAQLALSSVAQYLLSHRCAATESVCDSPD